MKHSNSDQLTYAELLNKHPVGLRELYYLNEPLSFEIISQIPTHSDLKNKLLATAFLNLFKDNPDYENCCQLFLDWISRMAQNAPKDIYHDYHFFSTTSNLNLIEFIIKAQVNSNTNHPDKLWNHILPIWKSVFEIIYIAGKTRIEAAIELNVSIIQVRNLLSNAIAALNSLRRFDVLPANTTKTV